MDWRDFIIWILGILTVIFIVKLNSINMKLNYLEKSHIKLSNDFKLFINNYKK